MNPEPGINEATIQLEGVLPLRWTVEDVATPFEPYIGKEDCQWDCTDEGPDGILDLTLKFDTQEVVSAIGQVTNRECLILTLTGELFDGTPIEGEEVVKVLKNKKEK